MYNGLGDFGFDRQSRTFWTMISRLQIPKQIQATQCTSKTNGAMTIILIFVKQTFEFSTSMQKHIKTANVKHDLTDAISRNQFQLAPMFQKNIPRCLCRIYPNSVIRNYRASCCRNFEFFCYIFDNRRKWSGLWYCQCFEWQLSIACVCYLERYFGCLRHFF